MSDDDPTPQGLLSAQAQTDSRLRALEAQPVVTTVQSSSFTARPGASYIIEAPVAGMRVVLPSPQSVTRGTYVRLVFRNANPVDIFPFSGTINKLTRLRVQSVTVVELLGDGMTGWYVDATSTGAVPISSLSPIASDTVLGNVSGSTVAPVAVPLSSLAGAGLAFSAHTFSLAAIAAKSVLANATNASAVPAALAGTAAFQHLRVNSANTGLEWAVLPVAAPITITGETVGFDQTAALGNNARVAVAKNSGATVGTRRQLNLIEGSGITITEADDGANERVSVTIAASGSSGLTQDQVLNLIAFRA